MLTLDKICKSFDGTPVLKDLSLKANNGEAVCIMAPSGAGKTTLANIIMGLIKPDSGSIDMPANTHFSCVFQQDRLLPQLDTIQNILFACPDATDKEISAALEATAMTDDAKKACGILSGGQKRRAAIIRAVLNKSDILIIDEPFKGLDDAVREKTAKFIKSNLRGRTLLCITHDAADAQALGARIFNL